MEKKPSSLAISYLLTFTQFFSIFTINRASAQTAIPIKVGVVLDMDSYRGQMGLNCISIALSDFYATNEYFKTRLVLIERDSKKDVVAAAAAALDLLKNVEVQAIIGPLSSGQAYFIMNLGDKAQVPIITFSATSPSLSSIRNPYFIRAALTDSSQVQAISAVIQAFGWREVVPIYVENEFGEGIIPFLTDALQEVNARIPYRSVIPSLATDDQIVAELCKLMTMQTRVFVVHMLSKFGARLFTIAKQLGMMTEEYVWIITSEMTYEFNLIDPSVLESMLGVIGVKPHIPKTEELDNFTIQYKKKIQLNNPTAFNQDLDIFGLWAYDSAVALALAVEKARVGNATFLKANSSRKSTDLEGLGVSSAGTELIQALSSTTFKGLAGNFQLVDGQLQSPPYQIVNLVGPGARVVGYWTKENGIIRELNFHANRSTHSTSKSNIGSIIWPGDKISPPKGWVVSTKGKKLRIGVPVKQGFSEFLHVAWSPENLTEVEGYCIDVFDAVMKALPYGVPYEYIPFATPDHKSAGSYNDLAYEVYLGNFDAAVGDITIVANRSQYVDFTLPYTESGVSMVVPIKYDKSKNAWVFLKPLTIELWLASLCSFIFIGSLIWILEHRINEDFRGPPWHQVGMIFWFAFSTMVFAHKERVTSNLARFVLIIWFFVVLILTQSYTASLTSTLTVQTLQPTITDVNELIRNNENIGYQNGSFVFGLLKSMNLHESRILAYNSTEELDELFSKGSRNGGIAAAFDEIPYMKLFLAKYCSKYTMVGPTYKTDGFGFIFPIGSSLVPDISRAILNVSESKKMMEIERAWLGDETKCSDSINSFSSNSLGLESFWGLFLMVGIAAGSAFIIYVIKFLYQNRRVIQQPDPESTISRKIIELLRRFNDKDFSSHTFKNMTMDTDGRT
ncbi:Glutamate-gated kainate-type ion channel receptor subunit GluR5 [Handroanthus impetiginosus]|uniref:Glutamate receptor n=1 Tax=Handroanthus impetiginosus TaxID=429701 RepID=A0A2G9GCQ5_9LAMI|nr:Glutamate-gated kainate-type ion channel receptor subunit GluR5 [Handroanthus impetiginosus]